MRAQGTYRDGFDEGFTFRRSHGRPMYRTPFAPVLAAQLGPLGWTPDEGGYIALDDPVATDAMGNVEAYTLVDLSLSYDLPVYQGLSLLVNVDNALNSKYRSFISAPEIGRLACVQLGASF